MKLETLIGGLVVTVFALVVGSAFIPVPKQPLTLQNQVRSAASRVDVPNGVAPKPEFEISTQALPGNPYYQRTALRFHDNVTGTETICLEISDYRSHAISCVDTGRKWGTR